MNKYLLLVIGVVVLAFIGLAFADWTGFTIVNQEFPNIQAGRDDDCPWSLVCDKDGNAHMVWEDRRTNPMQIYYRKRNFDGTWQNNQRASYEINQYSNDAFGHPSLCLFYNGDTIKIMIAYVDENGRGNGNPPTLFNRELRGNTYDGFQWGNSYYISDPWGYQLSTGSSGFWSTNMIVGADNYKYGFWIYTYSADLRRLYFNKCLSSWTPSNEAATYVNDDSTHESKHVNVCATPDSAIHLVYADKNPPNPYEIFYLKKTGGATNFGNYPGTQVSSTTDTNTIGAEFPSCAYSTVGGTRYLHVVWSLDPLGRIYYNRLNLSTGSWAAIGVLSPVGEAATRPTLACDSYGRVHVVWQVGLDTDNYYLKYRKYDPNTAQWSGTSTITLPDSIIKYGLPVLACDIYDNLHLTMVGTRQGQSSSDVFYLFNDVPPHAPPQPTQVFGYDNVHIVWAPNVEPDFSYYRIVRKYKTSVSQYNNITDTIWEDKNVPEYDPESSNLIYYWLYAVDNASQVSLSSETLAVCMKPGFSPKQHNVDGDLPSNIALSPSFPNPFNASTEIKYSLPFEHQVSITIFDILGRRIRTLVNENQQPGYKSVIWDGRNDNGIAVSSGIYLYRLAIADMVITKQMTLLK